MLFGNPLPFVVVDTDPKGSVTMGEMTHIRVKGETVKTSEEKTHEITIMFIYHMVLLLDANQILQIMEV